MKLVSGHTYLRGTNGEVVPYSESLAKASGYERFVQEGDFENDMQLDANKKIVARKALPIVDDKQREINELQAKLEQLQSPKSVPKKPMQPLKPQPIVKQTFEDGHMDITEEMETDLSGLE
jgi:hypothetical protein